MSIFLYRRQMATHVHYIAISLLALFLVLFFFPNVTLTVSFPPVPLPWRCFLASVLEYCLEFRLVFSLVQLSLLFYLLITPLFSFYASYSGSLCLFFCSFIFFFHLYHFLYLFSFFFHLYEAFLKKAMFKFLVTIFSATVRTPLCPYQPSSLSFCLFLSLTHTSNAPSPIHHRVGPEFPLSSGMVAAASGVRLC